MNPISFLLVAFTFALLLFSAPVFAQTKSSDTTKVTAASNTVEENQILLNKERSQDARAIDKEYSDKAKDAKRIERDAANASKQAAKAVRLEKKAQQARKKADKQKEIARQAAEKSDNN